MAKPRTTTRSPAIARSSSRFSPKRLPAAAAAAPRATKTPVKPATKAGSPPPRDGRLRPPPGRRRRRGSRERAGGHRASQTRRARQRTPAGPSPPSAVEAGELLASTLRSSSGSSDGRPLAEGECPSGRLSGRVRLQRRRATATAAIAIAPAARGSTQAIRLKPSFGGEASTASPNCATRAASISSSESPAAIRSLMKSRIRSAIGALESSSVVRHVGQMNFFSIAASVGGSSLSSPQPPASSAATPRTRTSARLIAPECRVPPARSPRAAHRRRADDVLPDQTAVAPDEPGLREPRVPESPEARAVPVERHRVREPVALDEALGVGAKVLGVDAMTTSPSWR